MIWQPERPRKMHYLRLEQPETIELVRQGVEANFTEFGIVEKLHVKKYLSACVRAQMLANCSLEMAGGR
jgi:hypothetical protein